jgi:hypothetical protein
MPSIFSTYPPITEPKTIKYKDVDKTGDNKDCPNVLLNLSIS